MSSDKAELDRITVRARWAADAASFAAIGITQAIQTGDYTKLRDAYEKAKAAAKAAEDAVTRLIALGADRPGASVAADAVPLHLLDTPATRRLLSALEAATKAAAEVDEERGWVDESGEPTGWGETLAGMALTLRREVFGPEGQDDRGRES